MSVECGKTQNNKQQRQKKIENIVKIALTEICVYVIFFEVLFVFWICYI